MVEGEDANRNENRERHEKLPCVEQILQSISGEHLFYRNELNFIKNRQISDAGGDENLNI